jgi:hypothetical protein
MMRLAKSLYVLRIEEQRLIASVWLYVVEDRCLCDVAQLLAFDA